MVHIFCGNFKLSIEEKIDGREVWNSRESWNQVSSYSVKCGTKFIAKTVIFNTYHIKVHQDCHRFLFQYYQCVVFDLGIVKSQIPLDKPGE